MLINSVAVGTFLMRVEAFEREDAYATREPNDARGRLSRRCSDKDPADVYRSHGNRYVIWDLLGGNPERVQLR
jgi:hypothetical protein